MRYVMAPLEGLAGFIYRNAQQHHFQKADAYYAPFVASHATQPLTKREIRDILPEHNQGIHLIPQILSNQPAAFLHTQAELAEYGYEEVNLNLGCPSGTVTAKGRGAGFLARPEELDRFLDAIFEQSVTKISIKTRIGMQDASEFSKLLEIFNQYPLTRLIIHPRTREDYYQKPVHRDIFAEACVHSRNPLCYNGDLFTAEDVAACSAQFPQVEELMLGRGVLRRPWIFGSLQGKALPPKADFYAFHEEIYAGYRELIPDERNVLFKMKDLWMHMIEAFPDHAKLLKQIRKAQHFNGYEAAVRELFTTRELK